MNIRAIKGDITSMVVDAIVNAANNGLRGGGGVDGAIHRAGGPAIMEACRKIGGCATGGAVETTAGNLKASRVIHTVGPVWQDGQHGEPELLASCYTESLEIVRKTGLHSVAFPNISTGVYGYPKKLAAQVAITAAKAYISRYVEAKIEVIFVCFDEENFSIYQGLLKG